MMTCDDGTLASDVGTERLVEQATVYRWNIRNGTGVLTRPDGPPVWFHLSRVEQGDVLALNEGDTVDVESDFTPPLLIMYSRSAEGTFSPGFGVVIDAFVSMDDLDPSGAMHNARYPLMFEQAVIEHWVSRGWSFDPAQSTIPDVLQVVRELSISYDYPVFGMGNILIHVWIEQMGRTSFSYGFEFRSADGTLRHAAGHRVQVRLDPATLQPCPLSDAGRAELERIAKPAVPGAA